MFQEFFKTKGEHPFLFPAKIGQLEGVLTIPDKVSFDRVAILGHPHSLQGGTMNNKVVTTLARTFKELGIPSLRFNFRGVGNSAGLYDAGIGESEDFIELASAWRDVFPEVKFYFAGFSFGSYVAYRASTVIACQWLISIAPPVHHYEYKGSLSSHWLVIQGEADEVVPAWEVYEWIEKNSRQILLERFPETGHFFHGQLIALREVLLKRLTASWE